MASSRERKPVDFLEVLRDIGQSVWLDSLQRQWIENGELEGLIQRGEISGVTSNPTIFHQAISKSNDYNATICALAWAGWDAEKIFWELAVEDIRGACDLFMPLYKESGGGDGFVSLEEDPRIANNTGAAPGRMDITALTVPGKHPGCWSSTPSMRKDAKNARNCPFPMACSPRPRAYLNCSNNI